MATDKYWNQDGLTASSEDFEAITPHDTNELARKPKALYVTVAGNLTVIGWGSANVAVTLPVTAGQVLDIRPKIVKSTGTTATVVGLY